MSKPLFSRFGFCPVCEKPVRFDAWGEWLRDTYICTSCGSVPRERALMKTIATFAPNWRNLSIHESSPGSRGASKIIQAQCAKYLASQYDASIPFGTTHPDGWQSENLEAQTFGNEAFDVVITQDVFEHIFHPDKAIKEISRTLKVGGIFVSTVPLTRGTEPSRRRAALRADGSVEHLLPAEYHQNPIDAQGSLVTIDWGYDITAFFAAHAPNLATSLVLSQDTDRGIEGPLTEVVAAVKRGVPSL